jgi:hypothetical protein
MKTFERPMTKRQRRELEDLFSFSTIAFRWIVFLGFFSIVALVFRGLQYAMGSAQHPWWAIPAVALAVAVYVRSKRWTGRGEKNELARADLAAGMVRYTVVEPAAVIEFEEFEDEGPSYLVESRDGAALLFCGQYLEVLKRREFPWSCFHIVEAPRSGLFFKIKRAGDAIPVAATWPQLPYPLVKQVIGFQRQYVVLDETGRSLVRQFMDQYARSSAGAATGNAASI